MMKTISFTIVACISLTLSDVNSDRDILKRKFEQNSTNRKNKTQLPETEPEPENGKRSTKLFFYNTITEYYNDTITGIGTKRWLLGPENNDARTIQDWFRQSQKKNKLQRKRKDKHGKVNNLKTTKQAKRKQHKNQGEEAHRNTRGVLKYGKQINKGQLLLKIEEDAHEILASVENFKENKEDLSVADSIAREIRILCLVLTCPKNHMAKAMHVKATWGKRCTRLLFMSTIHDVLVPTVRLPVKEGRDYLWLKVRAAFQYVYNHHRNDADWFLKADDDTYVILENLRYFLSAYNSTTPAYFGHRIYNVTQSYMHGGAGYVLSRAALNLLVKEGLPSYDICPIGNTASEDFEMGFCLENLGVKAIDPRDVYKFGRFFPHSPKHILSKNSDEHGCCSNYTISFHHVTPQYMYVYDVLIYNIRPFGIFY